MQLLRDIGAAITPFNSFLFLQGLETLSLRMERHIATPRRSPSSSTPSGEVGSVSSPACPAALARAGAKYGGGKGYGSVLAFIIKGGMDAGKRFVEALELHSHVANIGDVRSLVIHPATTTHSQLTAEEQVATGVDPGLVRLSVGLETIDDILADLDAGFAAAAGSAADCGGAGVTDTDARAAGTSSPATAGAAIQSRRCSQHRLRRARAVVVACCELGNGGRCCWALLVASAWVALRGPVS